MTLSTAALAAVAALARPGGLDQVDRARSGVAAASAARTHACVVSTAGDGSGRS